MSLTRIKTKRGKLASDKVLVLEMSGRQVSLTLGDLAVYDSAEKIKTEIVRQMGAGDLPEIFIHINRDGSLAMATGRVPEVWPEDVVVGGGMLDVQVRGLLA